MSASRTSRTLVAALLLAAGLVPACGPRPPGAVTAGPTMWETIQRSADAHGVWGRQTSLVAFSYLFGPLPGVNLPRARPDPAGFKVSGTGTINAVRNHWRELTEDQRRAVVKALSSPARTRVDHRFQLASLSDRDRAAANIQAALKDMIKDFAARMGGGVKLPAPSLVLTDEELSGGSRARAWALIGEGRLDQLLGDLGPVKRCEIHVPPSTWKTAVAGLSAPTRATIGHELFHCFNGVNCPDLATYIATPPWVGDGAGEFAGTDAAGASYGPPPNTWTRYLTLDVPLFQRMDSAMGWWFHLQHLGHDPWTALPPLWQSGTTVSEQIYFAVGGGSDDVYDTWASSKLRAPGYGDAWEVHGADVSPDVPAPLTQPAARAAVDVPAFDTRGALLTTGDAGVVRLGAANPVRLHDSGRFEDVHITEGDYCLGDVCVCPDRTERAGQRIQPVQGPLLVAVPGGEVGNSLVSDVVSLEDYCRRRQPDRRRPRRQAPSGWPNRHRPPINAHGPKDPGPDDGTGWRPKPAVIGDPHLISLDGHAFDFQASGEFTLVRSDSGDLEIQTRQQPRIGFDGKESRVASMTTAVGLNVAGDRVVFTADRERPGVRVAGRPWSVGPALPKGGRLAPVEDGYGVTWPDGTQVWVVNGGAADTVNVLFGPAEARKGDLHGLLGPYGDAGSTTMFDRQGRRYDRPDFDQLYRTIGDSWRVTTDGSLFDYGPGQSTATFTRRDLPAKPLALADLPTARQEAGRRACAGVPPELRDRCVLDVAVSGDDAYATGYRTLDRLTTTGGGDLALGERAGPGRLEPGQQRSFTIDSPTDTLYFAGDADCSTAASATVWWRVTAPDGHDTLQVPMCADAGRQHTARPGTWRIDVWVAPGAEQGGTFALHVAAAGPLRRFDLAGRTDVEGTLSGAGAEDRYTFTASPGDQVTLRARSACGPGRALSWGLENPAGDRVTLRARSCDDLGEQTITVAGTWAVAVSNPTGDESRHPYAFSVGRSR